MVVNTTYRLVMILVSLAKPEEMGLVKLYLERFLSTIKTQGPTFAVREKCYSKSYNVEKAHSCPLSSPLKISWSWRLWIPHTTMPKISVLWLRMTKMDLYIFNEHSRLFTAQLLSIVIQLTRHDPSWLDPTFYSKCWPKPIILSKTSGSFQNTWNENLCHCLSCTT